MKNEKVENYTVRVMSQEELGLVMEWATAEGWNPGLRDAQAFHLADPRGFLVGTIDGHPVASISAVSYGPGFGFLGFYIVKPAYRGFGFGLKIWQAGVSHLKGCHTVGLDGVVAQQENYKKSGFVLAHRNIRYEGLAPVLAGVCKSVIEARSVPFEELLAYDRRFFPEKRAAFLSNWLGMQTGQALAVREEGVIKGLGVIRNCRSGSKIGPLFADSREIAEALYQALGHFAGGGQIYLDVPGINFAGIQMAESYGLKPVFETARMYTSCAPDIDMLHVFGVSTFELG